IGEDYIELAFTFASEAAPDAELLYNDYSMFHKGKYEAAIRVANDLKSKGIRIDGIGMQAHYGLDYPTIEQFEEAILAISEAGLDVHITELDIDVLPSPWNQQGAEVSTNFEYEQRMNPYAEGLPDSVSVALNDRYMAFFNLFLEHHDKIKRVTTWGVTDLDSWKNNWPIRGRTNYPLLFDRNYQPKPVVHDIMNAAEAITE
ncbi:MAG: endo-1,4-beta-xylanase, partial [Bacteroidales bacterium]|nr:endo-1,4-beta-xylanase [Bacteroidales bacterium]